jgi:Raf kinase inhibitor-like YbhB/YbcL family protein
LLATSLTACSPSGQELDTTTEETVVTTTTTATSTTIRETTTTTLPDFAVSSPAFTDGGTIPVEFTCEGADVNPPLEIVGIPEGTTSLAIIVDDPDAQLGTWDHWVEFDIPGGSGTFEVPRGTAPLGTEAVNSWNLGGYMGPCPPETDDPHTYHFTIHALEGFLDLPPGVDSEELRQAMEGQAIATVEMTGNYGR